MTSKEWKTTVSHPSSEGVNIRGFQLSDIIGNLSFTSATFLLVKGCVPTPGETKVLDSILTAVLDYGLEKPGTAAARYVISANPSLPAGLATGMLAVGKHTLATDPTARFIAEKYAEYQSMEISMPDYAVAAVAQMKERKQRIPGIGHPAFKKTDPRAQRLRKIAVQHGVWCEAADLYEAIHGEFVTQPGRQDIPINDVGMMAVILHSMGFSPEEGTGMAILSTIPGLIAHISEELKANKPIRIIQPSQVDYELDDTANLEDALAEKAWSGVKSEPAASAHS